MKKLNLYFALLLTFVLFNVNAQTNLHFSSKGHPVDPSISKPAPARTGQLGKTTLSAWYNPSDFGVGTLATVVSFLLNDSAKFINETGVVSYNQADAALAQILDPKDDGIDLSNTPDIKLTRFTNYTLDSISLRYLYVRKIETYNDNGVDVPVVDTLFITYHKGGQVNTTGSFDTHTKFGMLGWNYAKQFASNYAVVDTILLNDTSFSTTVSSTGWGTGVLTFAPSKPVAVTSTGSLTNNLVAFSVRFKHGRPFDSTYVIEDRSGAPDPNAKMVNYFGYQLGNPTINKANDKFYNSSLTVPARFAFASYNGWTGWYPGYAYDSYQYPTAGFFVTALNVGIEEIKNDNYAMSSVYPNPASVKEGAIVAFNLKSASNVHVEIMNVVGQSVKVAANKSFEAGENKLSLDLTGLQHGVYFVNMTVNGLTTTKKLTVTE